MLLGYCLGVALLGLEPGLAGLELLDYIDGLGILALDRDETSCLLLEIGKNSSLLLLGSSRSSQGGFDLGLISSCYLGLLPLDVSKHCGEMPDIIGSLDALTFELLLLAGDAGELLLEVSVLFYEGIDLLCPISRNGLKLLDILPKTSEHGLGLPLNIGSGLSLVKPKLVDKGIPLRVDALAQTLQFQDLDAELAILLVLLQKRSLVRVSYTVKLPLPLFFDTTDGLDEVLIRRCTECRPQLI